jgi:hypothetical protein
MKKESANPFSKLLISLRSIKDPSKEDVSTIKDLISEAIGTLDNCLYLTAVGDEKEIKLVGENIIVLKKTLKSISWIISNSVAKKLSVSYNEEITDSSLDSNLSDNVEENFLLAVKTPADLEEKIKLLKEDCLKLIEKCEALKHSVQSIFYPIANRADILIQLDRDKNLPEISRNIKQKCDTIINNIKNMPVSTVISTEFSISELLDRMISTGVSNTNFNKYKEAYVKLKKEYSKLNYRHLENNNFFQKIRQSIERSVSDDESFSSDNFGVSNVPTVIDTSSEDTDEDNTRIATIIFTDKYDPIKKEAVEPGILQKMHTGLNEMGQNVISPFSDVVKRRIKIRNAINYYAKAISKKEAKETVEEMKKLIKYLTDKFL